MATDNETEADIVCDMRAYDSGGFADVWLHICSDRIEAAVARRDAAHKREVEELKTKLANTETARNFFAVRCENAKKQIEELCQCLKWARQDLCKGCRDKGFKCKKSEPCMTVLNIDIALHKALKGQSK